MNGGFWSDKQILDKRKVWQNRQHITHQQFYKLQLGHMSTFFFQRVKFEGSQPLFINSIFHTTYTFGGSSLYPFQLLDLTFGVRIPYSHCILKGTSLNMSCSLFFGISATCYEHACALAPLMRALIRVRFQEWLDQREGESTHAHTQVAELP